MMIRLLAILLSALAFGAAAQSPYLVRDINVSGESSSAGSDPGTFVSHDGAVYFSANSPEEGRELFKYEGGRVSLVRDIRPGTGSATPSIRTAPVGGRETLWLTANDGIHGRELWRTDGTAKGTSLVKDIHPTGDSIATVFDSVESKVLLSADDGEHGRELWVSDGTSARTQLLLDMTPGPASTSIRGRVTIGGKAYILTADSMWQTDGTPEGTTRLFSLNQPWHAGQVGNVYYFWNDDPQSGVELWRTEGTLETTRMVADIHSGPGDAGGFRVWGGPVSGRLLFLANDGNGINLWSTDGSAVGTSRVKMVMFPPGGEELPIIPTVGVSDGLGWFADDQSVWRTDGTEAGTFRVASIPAASLFVEAFSKTFFVHETATKRSIWVSDGTVAGTSLFHETGRTQFSASVSAVDGKLFFAGDDGTTGLEPYVCEDGTVSGIRMLANLSPEFMPSSEPTLITPVGNRVFFYASDGIESAPALWQSDGTADGTRRVVPLSPGGLHDKAVSVGTWGGSLYYNASDGLRRTDGTDGGVFVAPLEILGSFASRNDHFIVHARQQPGVATLWRSDGTPQGTRPLTSQRVTRVLAATEKLVYFVSADGLWMTDGSETGTIRIAEGDENSFLSGAALAEFFVFIRAGVLWRSDGTAGGTQRVSDNPMPSATILGSGGNYVFLVSDARIWRTDGTPQGTIQLSQYGSGRKRFVGERLFFVQSDIGTGDELWVTDGSLGGTRLLRDIRLGENSSRIEEMTASDHHLWFTADDGIHGREVWRSDGTEAGTVLVSDLVVGSASSNPAELRIAGGRLYYRAFTRATGTELWAVNTGDASEPGKGRRRAARH